MQRSLFWMTVGFMSCLSLSPQAEAPPATPPDIATFLNNILKIAEHDDLGDVAYSQSIFGPNLTADSDGAKDMHPASGLNLTGQGAGFLETGNLQYYYALVPMKSKLQFWKQPDSLFVAEFGFKNVAAFKCISGQDISSIFRADQNVGLLNTQSRTFHVAQGPNVVTEIAVEGPVEGDEGGCVQSLTILQHHMTEFVPSGGIGSSQ